MTLRYASLPLVALLAAAAHAAPFDFGTWTVTGSGKAIGTFATDAGPVTATLTGPFYAPIQQTTIYNPPSSFVGGIVGNTPNGRDVFRLDDQGDFSLTFSRPVTNVAFTLWSLGASGAPVSYVLNQPFSVVAGGPNSGYGGGPLVQSGNAVSGQEGNGTLLFGGTYSSLSWSVVGRESYSVLGIGLQQAQPTPEPASLAALSVGALALLRRRKRA